MWRGAGSEPRYQNQDAQLLVLTARKEIQISKGANSLENCCSMMHAISIKPAPVLCTLGWICVPYGATGMQDAAFARLRLLYG